MFFLRIQLETRSRSGGRAGGTRRRPSRASRSFGKLYEYEKLCHDVVVSREGREDLKEIDTTEGRIASMENLEEIKHRSILLRTCQLSKWDNGIP